MKRGEASFCGRIEVTYISMLWPNTTRANGDPRRHCHHQAEEVKASQAIVPQQSGREIQSMLS